jgi:hypothetical protein
VRSDAGCDCTDLLTRGDTAASVGHVALAALSAEMTLIERRRKVRKQAASDIRDEHLMKCKPARALASDRENGHGARESETWGLIRY